MNGYSELDIIRGWIKAAQRVVVLTGAGISTDSGIPDFRGPDGLWTKNPLAEKTSTLSWYLNDPEVRKAAWANRARTYGRPLQPNGGHHAVTAIHATGKLSVVVTQNVDGLHQSAGHQAVVDLHGRLDTVVCLDCQVRVLRSHHQRRLEDINPDWIDLAAARAPDGDAELESDEFDRFHVPPCRHCGGTLKPDVVFFGESVPGERVKTAMNWLDGADAMLIVGSSLMVYSGFRYARHAAERGIPIAALNLGKTRADPLLSLKVEAPCGAALSACVAP